MKNYTIIVLRKLIKTRKKEKKTNNERRGIEKKNSNKIKQHQNMTIEMNKIELNSMHTVEYCQLNCHKKNEKILKNVIFDMLTEQRKEIFFHTIENK